MKQILDRRRGCLFGLAIGDALGAAVEFRSKGSFAPVTGYRAGGPHSLDAGQWTDDTSLALALASSLERGFDLVSQIEEYIQWWQNGRYSVNGWCFDIGRTTRTALQSYMEGDGVRFCAPSIPESSGNGSIMRLAPIPIKYYDLFPDDLEILQDYGEESSLPTHASNQCITACGYLTIVLAALIKGENREVVLDPSWSVLRKIKDFLDPLVLKVAEGSFRENKEMKGSGWVIESLEAALWAFYHADSFDEAVLRAVNLGDDADTTGAVCGQLAGAYWGESGISEKLMTGLDKPYMIEDALFSLGAGTGQVKYENLKMAIENYNKVKQENKTPWWKFWKNDISESALRALEILKENTIRLSCHYEHGRMTGQEKKEFEVLLNRADNILNNKSN